MEAVVAWLTVAVTLGEAVPERDEVCGWLDELVGEGDNPCDDVAVADSVVACDDVCDELEV